MKPIVFLFSGLLFISVAAVASSPIAISQQKAAPPATDNPQAEPAGTKKPNDDQKEKDTKRHRRHHRHRRNGSAPQNSGGTVSSRACGGSLEYVDTNTIGEIIEGSACVQTTVNALRYGTVITRTISETAGKDLAAALQQPVTPPVSKDSKPTEDAVNKNLAAFQRKVIPDKTDCTSTSEAIYQCAAATVLKIDADLASREAQVRDLRTNVTAQLGRIKTFVQSSDDLLAGGAGALVKNAQTLVGNLDSIDVSWPDVSSSLDDIALQSRNLDSMRLAPDWPKWHSDSNNVDRLNELNLR